MLFKGKKEYAYVWVGGTSKKINICVNIILAGFMKCVQKGGTCILRKNKCLCSNSCEIYELL